MKYFAKYLPVEGEIKKGDKLIDPTLDSLGVIEALTDNEGVKIKARGGSKVKLFLCSRDIKVGDRVRKKNRELFPYPASDTDIEVLREHEAFKVIGEISSEATWVRER